MAITSLNFVTQQLLPALITRGILEPTGINTANVTWKSVSFNYLNRTLNLLEIDHRHWLPVIQICKEHQCRFASMWGEEESDAFVITSCFYVAKQYFLLRTYLNDKQNPRIASAANIYYAANRLERHCHDLLGIDFVNSYDWRRWTRHQAWSASEFPLRRDYPLDHVNYTSSTPADSDYPFLTSSNLDLYHIPVGPVHAGIIEPGHFRFHAAGEDIVYLEERLGYLHKGIEKIATTRTAATLLSLAARVSGDGTVAHSWAAAMALENALCLKIPRSASLIRAILCERERVTNHLWDVAALCGDVAFTFGYYQLGRLREMWVRTNAAIFQHRLMMDVIVLGGVKIDLRIEQIASMLKEIKVLEGELKELQSIIEGNSSLNNRLCTTGVLAAAVASELGVLGFVGKASAVDFDVRRDFSYPPYDELNIAVPIAGCGDVAARFMVRWHEIFSSLQILSQLLELLANLDSRAIVVERIGLLPNSKVSGVGIVEGWRGEIITYVSIDEQGNVVRFFPRDPSWFNWLALEKLIYHDIVPDFPVCNKSVNGSYAGCDL